MKELLFPLMAGMVLFIAPTLVAQNSQSGPDALLGIWLTAEGKARVEMTKTGDVYSGKIIWLKEPDEDGKPKVDKKNPDEQLRTRPIIGLEIVYGFTYDEDNEWKGEKSTIQKAAMNTRRK